MSGTYVLDKVYGMTVKVAPNGSGRLVKGLREAYGDALDAEDTEGAYLRGAVNTIESLVLSLACAGVDVSHPPIQDAIVTALDAIDNHVGEDE